jgi:hypothetical protein
MITLPVIDPTTFGIEVGIPYLWSKRTQTELPSGGTGYNPVIPMTCSGDRSGSLQSGSSPWLSEFVLRLLPPVPAISTVPTLPDSHDSPWLRRSEGLH